MEAENTTNNEHLKRMCNGKTSQSVKMRLINEVRESIASLKDPFEDILPSIFSLNILIASWFSETNHVIQKSNVIDS